MRTQRRDQLQQGAIRLSARSQSRKPLRVSVGAVTRNNPDALRLQGQAGVDFLREGACPGPRKTRTENGFQRTDSKMPDWSMPAGVSMPDGGNSDKLRSGVDRTQR